MKRTQLTACYHPSKNMPGLLRAACARLTSGNDEYSAWLRRLAGQSRVTRITSSSELTPACTQR